MRVQQHIDMTGQRFGNLLVVNLNYRHPNKKYYYNCLCDCGSKTIVRNDKLKNDYTQSCGCKTKERAFGCNKLNLTNQKFGRLFVIEKIGIKHGQQLWRCLCDCGRFTTTITSSLTGGITQSCGCLANELSSIRGRIDLTGQRFGKLLVTEQAGLTSGQQQLWKCLCDCGNYSVVPIGRLRGENTKSCGCLQLEVVKSRVGPKHQNYNPDLTDEERMLGRQILGYNEWKQQIKKDANFICAKCHARGGRLVSHHIESYHANKELRISLDNGACLCEICHRLFHKTYGNRDNTRIQFNEFTQRVLT